MLCVLACVDVYISTYIHISLLMLMLPPVMQLLRCIRVYIVVLKGATIHSMHI